MPTGQPDSSQPHPDQVVTTVDRIIREAMDKGEFDDLAGAGLPIPGKGTIDDDLWWVRCWLERNRDREDQVSSRPE